MKRRVDVALNGRRVRAYFAALPPHPRRYLRQLRALIRNAVPGTSDGFGYGIPSLLLDGKPFLAYAAWKRFCSLYPIGGAIRRANATALEGYETSKGTVRFPLATPLPVVLVKRLVKARVAEFRARGY